MMSRAQLTLLSVAMVVVAALLSGSFYTVDQGELGVVLTNGKLTEIAKPGLSFKIPVFQSVHKVSLRTGTWTWDKVNSYSADQQPADVRVSVTLHVDPGRVPELYSQFGTLEAGVSRVVAPHVLQQLKVVFGGYTAVHAIQDRGRFNAEVRSAIEAAIGAESPIVIESVQIENIDFSPEYIRSVEQRMQAEVEVQKLQQQALQAKVQAQITVTQAQATADATLAQARAQADATRLRGEAEADAIRAKGTAIRDNAMLVELVRSERWDGKLPTSMIPGATVPFLPLR